MIEKNKKTAKEEEVIKHISISTWPILFVHQLDVLFLSIKRQTLAPFCLKILFFPLYLFFSFSSGSYVEIVDWPSTFDCPSKRKRMESTLTYSLEDCINHIGLGKFQWRLIAILGCCSMADAVEMMLLAILGPALTCTWPNITEVQIASLTTVNDRKKRLKKKR